MTMNDNDSASAVQEEMEKAGVESGVTAPDAELCA